MSPHHHESRAVTGQWGPRHEQQHRTHTMVPIEVIVTLGWVPITSHWWLDREAGAAELR